MSASSPARYAVVGDPGVGKTTLARALADRISAPHIELDEARYGPDWREVPLAQFRQKVLSQIGRDSWVVDGNSTELQDLIWLRSDVLVWIDFRLSVVLWRLVRRTGRRLLARQELSGGQRERVGRLVSGKSILLWAIRSHSRRRRHYEQKLDEARYAHLQVARLRSPRQVAAWLAAVPGGSSSSNQKSSINPGS